MRTKTPFLLFSCSLLLLFTSYSSGENSTDAKPNVLFIAVDDLNDWVGYLGGHPQAETPHIDALAASGTAFVNSYCPAPVCGPSRTALMYGLAPHRSGSYGHHASYNPRKLIAEDQLPLNLVFQQNGYHTAGCGKIFHYREERGWDHYRGHIGGMVSQNRKRFGGLSCGILDTNDDSDTQDGQLTDWAIEQLNRGHEKPFFIALGLKKPHLPWEAPKKYFERFESEDVQLPHVPDNDLEDLPVIGKLFANALVGFRSPADHETVTKIPGAWKELVRAYLATCTFADANVGRILDALENSPHRDNTIVVLWGDHGWHLGEKKHWRKMSLWERGTRTPFIIKVPGGEPARIEAPVSLQDIFPTLVDLCQLELEQQVDGNSLVPLLQTPSMAWDKPVLMSHGPGNFAVRHGPWRLIRYADGGEELYHLGKDPGEYENLAIHPGREATRATLRAHIPESWRYVMGPRFKKFSEAFSPPVTGE
ncbi:iduronate-2-sulfatase [Coraliomargarita sinensis]|uniref:Iduronate-2-sulfatase n=1 Tax=Coraliomargarita sinensis TaxID=2174842 RepID=A0A317ZE19_9BACT|nr:sulfatase [Coraliomargarita sinensis]PXA03615.1 iduronate-2-sulfatase [Coraliomargarita sinensis]